MDQILEGLFLSEQPDKLKEALITRICEQNSRTSHSEATVRGVLQVSSKWILHGTTTLQVSSGFKLFKAWGSQNIAIFQSFFTPALVAEMLKQGSGMPANVPLLLREGLRVMLGGARTYYDHSEMVQMNITKFVCRAQERIVVRNVVLLFEEFNECVPSDESDLTNFCLAVLNHLSVGVLPQREGEIPSFIKNTDEIAKCLGTIWKTQPPVLLAQCLAEIFNIISAPRTEEQLEPAICLAAVVKHIPIEIANKVVRDIVTDNTVTDKSVAAAMYHIMEWLKWPTAQNVELWLLCFLIELGAARKYSLLSCITENYIVQVVQNLEYPHLRQASFRIVSHLLLGFQHSPGPFHKCLEKICNIILNLRDDRTPESGTFLTQISVLIYCLMYQHAGFPELYEPVLDLIKSIPQPEVEQIKEILNQAKWSSQTACSVVMQVDVPSLTMTSIKQEKLEAGKTGLENLGNTCYMNSVLQALYMCEQFRRDVLTKTPHGKENLLVKLQHVFAHLSQSNRPTMTPTKFLQASRPPWFLPGHQQDCSEFLKHMLNKLHEDEKSSYHSGIEERPSSEFISSTETIRDTLNKTERKKEAVRLTAVKMKALEEMNGQSSLESCNSDKSSECLKSLVERTFLGKVQTKLRCLACNQESFTVESFVDIPLAFPNSSRSAECPYKNLAGGGGVPSSTTETENMQVVETEPANPTDECFSLNDLISFYFKPEKLTGDNKYYCEKCAKLQDGEKNIQIIESPNYLILTLLRFSYDTKLQTRTKIFQDVHYPRTLSIPVCTEHTCNDSELHLSEKYSGNNSCTTSSKSCPVTANSHLVQLEDIARHLAPKCENTNQDFQSHLLYGLSSVIIHSGTSSECGHYYCYARHSQSGQINPELLKNNCDSFDNLDLLPDKWYNFNDSRVSPATFDSFSNVTKRFSKDTAYVLIYRRLDQGGRSSSGVDMDQVLRADLRDAVIKDNEAYLKEQEMEARIQEEQRRRKTSSVKSVNLHTWHGKDDDHDPDGGNYGWDDGFGNGLDINGSRFVF